MAWWIHLSWSHAALIALVVLIALGSLIVFLEKPVCKRMSARRMRRLRNQTIPKPDGAIVPNRTYFVTHWNAAVGRAYRA